MTQLSEEAPPIRAFSNKKVSVEIIEELLNAASQTPRFGHQQPGSFIVIQNEGLLRCISNEIKQPYFDAFYGASTLIIVCSEEEGTTRDCALMAKNLKLAALAFGLETYPIGRARDVLHSVHYRHELAIPTHTTPILPIVVGYPKANSDKAYRNPVVVNWKR